MELKEWIAVGAYVMACASLIVAIVALRRTTGHNTAMRQFASAAPDIGVLTQINQARMIVANILPKFTELTNRKPNAKLTEREQRQNQDVELAYLQAVEILLNTYDFACRLYLDGSLERGRFRRQYEADVRKLVEEGTDDDKARLAGISSPYKALRAVYEEWFNKE